MTAPTPQAATPDLNVLAERVVQARAELDGALAEHARAFDAKKAAYTRLVDAHQAFHDARHALDEALAPIPSPGGVR